MKTWKSIKNILYLTHFISILVSTSVTVDPFLLIEKVSYSEHEETYGGSATLPEWIDRNEV